MAQVKKISVGAVYGKIKKADLFIADPANPGKVMPRPDAIHVMRVGGMAVKHEDTYNEVYDSHTTKFSGDFKAISAATGEEMRASVLYLPKIAETALSVQMEAAGDGKGVGFLIDVFVRPDQPGEKETATGYQFTFEHVLPPQGDDPVQRLFAAAKPFKAANGAEVGGAPMLEAPKSEADKPASRDSTAKNPATKKK